MSIKKNYVLYSKVTIQENGSKASDEGRIPNTVRINRHTELTDIQKRLLPLTMHHPAEETSEAQKGWCARID